jgi:C4-dicarboxylate transporter, DctM subunit
MINPAVALVLVVFLLIGLASGIPVALVLILGGVFTFFLAAGGLGLSFIGSIAWENSFNWELSAVPVFVLMGYILQESGFVKHLFRTLAAWLGWLPGSLAIVALVTSGMFAAMSGSGSATAATIGVAIRPEAERYKYNKRLVLGVVSGGACLAPVIPPSIALIVYGTLSQTSITKLFVAGIVPGLAALALMLVYVIQLCIRHPELAPPPPAAAPGERLATLWVWPVSGLIIFTIMGGILFGWYTPTEAGAIGILLATGLLIAGKRRDSLSSLWTAIQHATTAGAFIVLLVVAGFIFSNTLTVFGLPQLISVAVAEAHLQVWQIMAVLVVLLFVLGMFVDSTTMQVLTVPFLVPILRNLGVDLVWFGIFHVFMVEIGTMTPPFGMHLFILQGTMGARFQDAVMGGIPFIALWLVMVGVIVSFPDIATWLPGIMGS